MKRLSKAVKEISKRAKKINIKALHNPVIIDGVLYLTDIVSILCVKVGKEFIDGSYNIADNTLVRTGDISNDLPNIHSVISNIAVDKNHTFENNEYTHDVLTLLMKLEDSPHFNVDLAARVTKSADGIVDYMYNAKVLTSPVVFKMRLDENDALYILMPQNIKNPPKSSNIDFKCDDFLS